MATEAQNPNLNIPPPSHPHLPEERALGRPARRRARRHLLEDEAVPLVPVLPPPAGHVAPGAKLLEEERLPERGGVLEVRAQPAADKGLRVVLPVLRAGRVGWGGGWSGFGHVGVLLGYAEPWI